MSVESVAREDFHLKARLRDQKNSSRTKCESFWVSILCRLIAMLDYIASLQSTHSDFRVNYPLSFSSRVHSWINMCVTSERRWGPTRFSWWEENRRKINSFTRIHSLTSRFSSSWKKSREIFSLRCDRLEENCVRWFFSFAYFHLFRKVDCLVKY